MTRARRLMTMGALLLVFSALPVQAQGPPRIDLRIPNGPTLPIVGVRDVLSIDPFDELLRNGFPARLHFQIEVWVTGKWFNDIVDQSAWDVIVRYNQIDRTYDVARVTSDGITSLGSYTRFADARAASELLHAPSLNIPTGRRGYFAVHVDVQTLDISDLAEMQRWLQGEARPAVQGKRNPGTALSRGLRTLVSRLLGGEVRRLETQSAVLQF